MSLWCAGVLPRDEAVAYFKGLGEDYKAELIANIPSNEDVSLYREGAFEDLCRGPHVPSTGKLKHFKLMKVAGAYWRGDRQQRDAATHLRHRLGQQGRAAAVPAPRWKKPKSATTASWAANWICSTSTSMPPAWCSGTPRAGRVWQEVEQYMRPVYRDNGYQEVKGRRSSTRPCGKRPATGTSTATTCSPPSRKKRDYALKPMNCPGHILIFKQGIKSYRDLPCATASSAQRHRNEPIGGLHGIMRVRGFTQDDGHIFCYRRPDPGRVLDFTKLLQKVYADFGFTDIIYKVSYPS